jgi:hypothetical protein
MTGVQNIGSKRVWMNVNKNDDFEHAPESKKPLMRLLMLTSCFRVNPAKPIPFLMAYKAAWVRLDRFSLVKYG